jgi:catechol 2,3-dioxygenase-like lactoylglutathione lyase family enzyme
MSAGPLHHLELYVRDLEVSMAFWGWLLPELGYEPYEEWDEGISFRVVDEPDWPYLALVQSPEGARDLDRRSVGLNHLAFRVAGPAEVDRLTTALRARDARVLYEDRHPHAGGPDHYAVFFEDPDGLKVEVIAADPESDVPRSRIHH